MTYVRESEKGKHGLAIDRRPPNTFNTANRNDARSHGRRSIWWDTCAGNEPISRELTAVFFGLTLLIHKCYLVTLRFVCSS
jgi:hypothetical protein